MGWTQRHNTHIYDRNGIELCRIKQRGRYYRVYYDNTLGILPAAFDFRDVELAKHTVEQSIEHWLATTYVENEDEN